MVFPQNFHLSRDMDVASDINLVTPQSPKMPMLTMCDYPSIY